MRLFWRIFLSFWIGTVLMVAAVLSVNEIISFTSPDEHKTGFETESAKLALTEAVNDYETRGKAALDSDLQTLPGIRNKGLYLISHDGDVLAADSPVLPFDRQLAREVLQDGRTKVERSFLSRPLFACLIQSESGRRYSAVLTIFSTGSRLLHTRFWFNLAIAMFPSALVCLALSFYITRPITRLRSTAQRLADGDLSARYSPHRIARMDEVGDLGREFDTMATRIQQLMTAQRRFVADVSHELGAPLTRMHLALALLRRESAGKDTENLKRIERETDKLSNLVQQLLLLAGLEAGRCPAETMAAVSLHSVCESIVEDADFEAKHAQCRIVGQREDVTLLAYPQLLRRAIDNVLRNAIRYTPGGSDVLLNCKANGSRTDAIIEILDSGPGVPDSMLPQIFLPFFRTAPGRESESGGTGLGLAIAAESVHLHGGSISARNRKSGGLQVTITLPIPAPRAEYQSQDSKTSVRV